MRKQLGVCVGVCRAATVTVVINLLYSCCLFDITYWFGLILINRWLWGQHNLFSINPYHSCLPLTVSLSLLEINNMAIWSSFQMQWNSQQSITPVVWLFPLVVILSFPIYLTHSPNRIKPPELIIYINGSIYPQPPLPLTSFPKSQKWSPPFLFLRQTYPPVFSNIYSPTLS